MNLKKELQKCNRKSVDDLGKIYLNNYKEENFYKELLHLITIESLQVEATWLLKKHLENENKLEAGDAITIWKSLPSISVWEARLHILQCFSLISITINDKDLIETFLRESLGSKNKFVRAWSYGGFYELANQFSEYRQEAIQLIENAMINESASVKARLRNVKKRGFLNER